MPRLIRYTDQPSMQWKNGGGSTVELLTSPEGAALADFDFRISVATVSKDGPFSLFPGVDRTLALVEGAGLTLHFDTGRKVVVDPSHPVATFPGEAVIHATVNGRATMDFNVMTQRSCYRHTLEVYEGGSCIYQPQGDITLLFHAGGGKLMAGKLGIPPTMLYEYDMLVLDPGVEIATFGIRVTFFIIELYQDACTVS